MCHVLVIPVLILLCAYAQAAEPVGSKQTLDIDVKALAKGRAKDDAEMENKINKKIIKEDKYLRSAAPEFEGINKENMKKIQEFSRPTPPTTKNKGDTYVH